MTIGILLFPSILALGSTVRIGFWLKGQVWLEIKLFKLYRLIRIKNLFSKLRHKKHVV
jgi:hypothetical protein